MSPIINKQGQFRFSKEEKRAKAEYKQMDAKTRGNNRRSRWRRRIDRNSILNKSPKPAIKGGSRGFIKCCQIVNNLSLKSVNRVQLLLRLFDLAHTRAKNRARARSPCSTEQPNAAAASGGASYTRT